MCGPLTQRQTRRAAAAALSEQQGTPGAPGSVRTTHLISDGGSTFKFVCFFVLFFALKSSEPSSPRCVRTKCLVQTRSSVVQRVQQHHGRRVLSLQLWKQKVFNTSVPARLWSLCVFGGSDAGHLKTCVLSVSPGTGLLFLNTCFGSRNIRIHRCTFLF